jgi:hypothetical protein
VLRTQPLPITNTIQLALSCPNVAIKQLENNETDFDKNSTVDIFVRTGDDIPISVKFGEEKKIRNTLHKILCGFSAHYERLLT